jgi:hypothetical protein
MYKGAWLAWQGLQGLGVDAPELVEHPVDGPYYS